MYDDENFVLLSICLHADCYNPTTQGNAVRTVSQYMKTT